MELPQPAMGGASTASVEQVMLAIFFIWTFIGFNLYSLLLKTSSCFCCFQQLRMLLRLRYAVHQLFRKLKLKQKLIYLCMNSYVENIEVEVAAPMLWTL